MKMSRHYYWTNFIFYEKHLDTTARIHLTNSTENVNSETDTEQVTRLEKELGFDLSKLSVSLSKKRLMLRNCVEPELGEHILNCAIKSPSLFGEEKIKETTPLF